MKKYTDKHGNTVKAGCKLHFITDDTIETVYACCDPYGEEDLGINATNEQFLFHHPEHEREYYPLSSFNHNDYEIVKE